MKAIARDKEPDINDAELEKICDYTAGQFVVNAPHSFRGAYRALKKAVRGGLYDEK